MTSGPLHLNTLVHNIIALLKRHEEGLTFDRLKTLLHLDIFSSPELLSKLKNNPRIIFTDLRLIYRPKFSIKDYEELIGYLKDHRKDIGIPLLELKESYKNVEADLSLHSYSNDIIRISMPDSINIYYNPMPHVKPAPEDVRLLWASFAPNTLSFLD